MKDVITTIAGLVVVGLVVIATFLYGNQQREDQQLRDQQAEQTQQDQGQVKQDQDASVTQKQPPAPQQEAKPSQDIQGGQKPPVVAAPIAPVTPAGPGPASGRTPETGGEEFVLVPVLVIALFYFYNRQTGKSVRLAALRVKSR